MIEIPKKHLLLRVCIYFGRSEYEKLGGDGDNDKRKFDGRTLNFSVFNVFKKRRTEEETYGVDSLNLKYK